jgi:hypothetical protein
MKKLFTLLFFFSLCAINFAQTNFKWEATDSTAKTKTQIYADTKLFIAQTWNSAKDVIQNDDKESGVILLKGLTTVSIPVMGLTISTYDFGYTIQFRMKDGKYRITIDNVSCDRATSSNSGSHISPISLEGYRGMWKGDCMSEKKYNELIDKLKTNLTALVLSYQTSMKKPTVAIADNF